MLNKRTMQSKGFVLVTRETIRYNAITLKNKLNFNNNLTLKKLKQKAANLQLFNLRFAQGYKLQVTGKKESVAINDHLKSLNSVNKSLQKLSLK